MIAAQFPHPAADKLPEDVPALQGMVLELSGHLERLKHELLLLRRWRFGSKSEKYSAHGQLSLFPDAMPEEIPMEEKSSSSTPKINGHGRRALPAGLPVERVVVEPPAEELVCRPCGTDKVRIGEEVRRELDYVPGSIFVRELVRPIYACPNECEGQVTVAKNPSAPIEKGLAGPGLLAHVAVSKYADHLPLNRMEGILARAGVNVSRSTMADWMADGAHLLTSLVAKMKADMLLSGVIHTDDTPVTVQDPKGKSKPRTGRIWVYSGDRHHPYDIYEYSPNRKSDHPGNTLSGWKGFLQADAYRGYDALFDGDIVEAACWAHARRKFVEAESSDKRASEMLARIRELYRVEKRVKSVCGRLKWSFDSPGKDGDMAEEFRRRRRRKQAAPVLDEIESWLRGPVCATALPKSPFGEAVGYCLNNWEALRRYSLHGELSIDNNAAERKLRPVAVGRKNYLFFGSDAGGRTAAAMYTVIASAKRHGLDVWKYLRDVFSRLPDMTVSQVHELLPDKWKDSHDK
jgi:transposase